MLASLTKVEKNINSSCCIGMHLNSLDSFLCCLFFRQHWRIKSGFKRMYSRLNKAKSGATIEWEVRNGLSNLFRPDNERLAEILEMNNYSNLPDWVRK